MRCLYVKEKILTPYLEEKNKAMYELNYSYLSQDELVRLEEFHKEIYVKLHTLPTLCVIRSNKKVSICENVEDFVEFMDARII